MCEVAQQVFNKLIQLNNHTQFAIEAQRYSFNKLLFHMERDNWKDVKEYLFCCEFNEFMAIFQIFQSKELFKQEN